MMSFALAGGIVPIMFSGLTTYVQSVDNYDAKLAFRVERLMLLLWPSALINMATDGLHHGDIGFYLIPLLAVLLNVLLYLFVGAFVWLGIRKNKAFFIAPALSLAVIWWRLLG